jgi:hypothetical protein
MAYSNNPALSTYKTQRLTFVGSPQQRDGTTDKDQRFINLFPELIKSPITDGKKYYLKKRPGLQYDSFVAVGEGRGLYYYQGIQYAVIAGTLYANGAAKASLGTTTGPVGFTEYNGTSDYLILLDGVKGWTINKLTGAVLQITSANFPTPHLVTPVSLDGYLAVAKAGTADIYNSNVNDPFTWNPANFITAEMFPDNLTAILKNNNYILAIGTSCVEFFYDAANATGSPFLRNDSAVQQFGSNAPFTAVQTDNEVVFVGDSGNGGRGVWLLDGFKSIDVSIEPVKQALDAEGANIANATADCIRISGHKFYILTLVGSQRNLVYDFDEKMWHEWSFGNPNNTFLCQFVADSTRGFPYMLHSTAGTVMKLSETTFDDSPTGIITYPITCVATTIKLDFETMRRKFMYRLSIVGDSPNNTTNSPISVEWSDNDYNTWSTPRPLPMNGTMSALTRLGHFRRRAFRFTYSQPYLLRLEAIEVEINVGAT